MGSFHFSRRRFLQGAAYTGLLAALPLQTGWSTPRLTSLDLTAAPTMADIAGSGYPKTDVWAYNESVPGPILRLKQGDVAEYTLKNQLPEATTIHWHGIRVPNEMDGVPGLTQDPVMPGQDFLYSFAAEDAGTFWYHPHKNSTEQVERGLQGLLIVEEEKPIAVDRDVAWVLDDWRFDDQAAITDDFNTVHDMAHGGRYGNAITLNGSRNRDFPILAGERLRIRLLNSANGRIFALKFEGHAPWVIALDGHGVDPYPAPEARVVLGPGQRVDVILDAPHEPGQSFRVADEANPRFTYLFQNLVYGPENPVRTAALAIPDRLAKNPLPEPDLNNAKRHHIRIQGGAHGNLTQASLKGETYDMRGLVDQGKVWALNQVAFGDMNDPMLFQFNVGQTQIITMKNDTGWPHPMHIHGHTWKVLTRNGKAVSREEWGDTVLLAPEEEAEVAFVADNPGKWLLHCHVLEHMKGGMGCIFEVA